MWSERVPHDTKPTLWEQGLWYCGCCQRTLPVSQFSKSKWSLYGLTDRCKACEKKRQSKRKKRQNFWQKKAGNLNNRHKNKIDVDFVKSLWDKQEGRCYYCEMPLDFDNPRRVTIDHVVPGRHEKENLVFACRRCNRIKSDATPEELKIIAAKIEQHTRRLEKKNNSA